MKLPKSWKDITISQYQDLLPSALKGKNEIETVIHTLSVVTGMPKDEVRKLSLKEARELNKKLSFLNTPYKGRYKKRFRIGFKWFRVDPDANSLSAGGYMDAMSILKDISRDEETIEKNLHLLLAIVCRPVKLTWKGWKDKEVDLIETSKLFYDRLTMDIANPIIVFFCLLSKDLTPIIESYSRKQLEKTERELMDIEKDLRSSSGG